MSCMADCVSKCWRGETCRAPLQARSIYTELLKALAREGFIWVILTRSAFRYTAAAFDAWLINDPKRKVDREACINDDAMMAAGEIAGTGNIEYETLAGVCPFGEDR